MSSEDPKRLCENDDLLADLFQAARSDKPSHKEMRALAAGLGPLLVGSGVAAGTAAAPGGSAVAEGAALTAQGSAIAAKSGTAATSAIAAGGAAKTGALSVVGLSGSLKLIGGGAALLAGGVVWGISQSDEPAPHLDSRPTATVPISLPEPPIVEVEEAEPSAPAPAVVQKALKQTTESDRAIVAQPLEEANPRLGKRSPRDKRPAPAVVEKPGAKPASEASLLRRAQVALRNGQPERALQLAKQHRAKYPKGALVQEREVIAIEAHRRLGNKSEAERRGEDFKRRYPGSAHQRKVGGAD